MEAKLVTHRESKEARQRAAKIISCVRKHKNIDVSYKFYHQLIGSGKRKCITKDSNGKYDLDFQIILTKNSKQGDENPTKIKRDFLDAFTSCSNANEKVENSTTVITVRVSKSEEKFDSELEKFSFDFVIISIDGLKRIKRNGPNDFTWTELPQKNEYIYKKFKSLSGINQRKLLEKFVIPKVIKEKEKHESLRKPSVDIFLEAVNNHGDQYE